NVLSFFFQAEDGIRDRNVTGVQTCALPIFLSVTNQFFNLLNNIVILVTYQKLCLTSLLFLVGHQRVKTKSLTSVNSSSNLTLHVCLSHLLLLTKRNLNGLTTNTSRRLIAILCLI